MDGIHIDFVYATPPSSSELAEALERLLEEDCTTQKDGKSELCRYKLGWGSGPGMEESDSVTAFKELSERKAGYVKLFCHGSDGFGPLGFSVHFIDDSLQEWIVDAPEQFIFRISVDEVYLDRLKLPEEELQAYSDRLLTLTKSLYKSLNPVHVVGWRLLGIEESLMPVSPLEIDDVSIERPVDWLAIFTPETLEKIGSDWAAPGTTWKQERLDDDSLLVILAPHPDDLSLDERLEELGKRL